MKRYESEDSTGARIYWEGSIEVLELPDGSLRARIGNKPVSGSFDSVDDAFKILRAAQELKD